MKLTATVASGIGQGAQFLTLDWVARELREKLGLMPFPGTLNLRVAPQERAALFARRHDLTKIANPSSSECPGYLMRVTLRANGKSTEAYLILPEKSQYTDVLEIIASISLRDTLALHDGTEVVVETNSDFKTQAKGRRAGALIGILYTLTGLLLYNFYVFFVGAMLGMFTVPITGPKEQTMRALYMIPPALLVVGGATTLAQRVSRSTMFSCTAAVILLGLSWWTIPRIGWGYAFYLILQPIALSLFISGLLLLILRKVWFTVLVGSLLSVGYFAYGIGGILYPDVSNLFVLYVPRFYASAVWLLFAPLVLSVLSAVAASRFRAY